MIQLRAIVAAAIITLPIAALARAPYTPPGADDAVLRFAWRMNAPARENCRPRTQQELDALPVHMRAPEVCTRDAAGFALIMRIDGAPPDTMHLVRGGMKGDRPIFVLEERTVIPGTHAVVLELQRVSASGTSVVAALDTVLRLEPGDVSLVTLHADDGALLVRSSPRRRQP
jgi:hypothetical protein